MSVRITGGFVNSSKVLLDRLHTLYIKKVTSEEQFTESELKALSTLNQAKLLQVFVHPDAVIEFPKGYIAPLMELQMIFQCVTGTDPISYDYAELLRFAHATVKELDAGVVTWK